MNIRNEIRSVEHVYDIVEDTENKKEVIDNNLYTINRELRYDNNISVRCGDKYSKVQGRGVV
jgi:hypothetical protein